MSEIQGLKIQGSIVSPSSPQYEQAISRWSEAAIRRAAYVFYPVVPSDIAEILRYARSQAPPLDIAVKCGGHDSSGTSSSDGGIVIDLARINHVNVSEDKKTVTVGGGALWGDVYAEIENHELEVVGGGFSSVGVGGYTTGGGYSVLSGRYGLGVDNVVQATVVLADGRIVICSADEESDLFWAVRGGGSQFGVVVEFVLKSYPVREPAQTGILAYPGTQLPALLEALQVFLSLQQQDSIIMMFFSRMPPYFQPSIAIMPYIKGSPDKAEQLLSPFYTNLQPVFQRIDTVPSLASFARANDRTLDKCSRRFISSTAPFSKLWDDVVTTAYQDWVAFTEAEEFRGSMLLWEFPHSDKIAEVKEDATAFPLRVPHYYVVVMGSHSSPEGDSVSREWVTKTAAYIRKANVEKTGVTLPTPAYCSLPGYEDVVEVYGGNYARLRKLKAK